ncbi:MAG: hypothetical protein K6F75_03600 [Butyrivibrio sp.]|nr:hypothetical protein [Butyrivibrio sp.]
MDKKKNLTVPSAKGEVKAKLNPTAEAKKEIKVKQNPTAEAKKEIKVKQNPTAEAIKKAPDEVIARAIHDALTKEHEKGFTGKKK